MPLASRAKTGTTTNTVDERREKLLARRKDIETMNKPAGKVISPRPRQPRKHEVVLHRHEVIVATSTDSDEQMGRDIVLPVDAENTLEAVIHALGYLEDKLRPGEHIHRIKVARPR